MADHRSAVLRRFHEAWTEGDLPTVLDLVDPDVVAHPLHGVLFSRMEFRGRDGIADWYREMTGPWDRFEALVERAADTPRGAQGVLTVVGYRDGERFHARVGVDMEVADGRIVSLDARNVTDVEDELDAAEQGRG